MGLKKNFYTFFGTITTLIALVIFSLSIANYLIPSGDKDPESTKEFAFTTCAKVAKNIKVKYKINSRKTVITFTMDDVKNWEKHLGLSSILISNCPGFEILRYCTGGECQDRKKNITNGTSMILIYKEKI